MPVLFCPAHALHAAYLLPQNGGGHTKQANVAQQWQVCERIGSRPLAKKQRNNHTWPIPYHAAKHALPSRLVSSGGGSFWRV